MSIVNKTTRLIIDASIRQEEYQGAIWKAVLCTEGRSVVEAKDKLRSQEKKKDIA